MLLVAWRDLQFRKRRYLISVAAASLVFAMTLLLAGLAASFDSEIDKTMTALGADHYVIAENATGPFLGSAPMPINTVERLRKTPGVVRADPIVFRTMTVDDAEKQGVGVFGIAPGGLGSPPLFSGSLPDQPREAVVDRRLGAGLGQQFAMGGSDFVVSGTTEQSTLLGGTPNVFVQLADLQRIGFGGANVINAVAIEGRPEAPPPKLEVLDVAAARGDLARPLAPAREAITFVSLLLWAVAICIIGSVVYLSALERVRDFAVLKATGTSNLSVLGGLVVQAVIVSLAAALVATIVAVALAPMFPVPMEIPLQAAAFLPTAAAAAGIVASAAGVRRAMVVDPAVAFGGP